RVRLACQGAPRRTGVQSRTNLPAPLTSFIGRADELSEVQQCLTSARIVTLTGAGGVGKTRLALRVAEEVMDAYPIQPSDRRPYGSRGANGTCERGSLAVGQLKRQPVDGRTHGRQVAEFATPLLWWDA